MVDILDYAEYPSKEEWRSIYNERKRTLDKIKIIAQPDKPLDLFDLAGIQFSYWILSFNNRSFDLINNYVLVKHIYNQQIPDEEWYISPGKEGNSVSYFPHFQDHDFANLYWFGFYLDSYYTRFFGLIDTLYHLTNTKYRLHVEEKPSFKGDILKKLKGINKELYSLLNKLKDDAFYKKISIIRNNITHNASPHQIDSGVTYKKNEQGEVIGASIGIGKYTTSNKFIENIDKSLDFLVQLLDDLKPYLSK